MIEQPFPSTIEQVRAQAGGGSVGKRKAGLPMIVRMLVLLAFGALGLVMLTVGVRQFTLQRRLLTGAQAVEAQIIESHVKGSPLSSTGNGAFEGKSTRTYEPIVRFRYQVGREQFESDLLRPTVIVRTYASTEGAQEQLAPFPVGAHVTAHVRADEPDKAFLLAEASWGPVVFIIIGALLPALTFLVTKYI